METVAVVLVILALLSTALVALRSRHASGAALGTPGIPVDAPREIVRIELGASILEAELIEQRLTAQGFTVSLLRNEHPETGSFSALGSAVLLVLRDEEDDVRAVLDDVGY